MHTDTFYVLLFALSLAALVGTYFIHDSSANRDTLFCSGMGGSLKQYDGLGMACVCPGVEWTYAFTLPKQGGIMVMDTCYDLKQRTGDDGQFKEGHVYE